MAEDARARSGDPDGGQDPFAEAPTRMGLPFRDPEGAARSGAQAKVIPMRNGDADPTAVLGGAAGAGAAAPAGRASSPASNRRRRRERRGVDGRSVNRPEDRVGQVLSGTYRIERLIAVGGMGAVYEVAHTRLSQRFAAKFLDRALSREPEAYARFRQEAEIAARINHDNVVQVVDFNTDDMGSPYMVMELVEGETLDHFMKANAPVERDEFLAIFGPLCRALAACHARGIVHRDLKPSNIMVRETDDGVYGVKLLDFGISKIKQDGGGDMTRENVVMGTPNYMSPEQASGRNRDVDARTDVFALGAIAYEMLSGEKAFDAEGLPQLLHAIVYDSPDSLADHGVPSKVDEVIAAALAKEADERTKSAEALFEGLQVAFRRRLTPPSGGQRSGLGIGAWLSLLVLSMGVTAAGTYAVVPHAVRPAPAPAATSQPAAAPAKAPKRPPIVARDYGIEVVNQPSSLFAVEGSRLYRADQSSLAHWTDPDAEARSVVLPSSAGVTALQLSTDQREVLVGQADGWVSRWDHGLKDEGWSRRFGKDPVLAVAAGSGYLAVATGTTVRLTSAKTNKTLRSFGSNRVVDTMLLTPGKDPLLLVFRGDEMQVIDADRRRLLDTQPIGRGVLRAGLAHAGKDGLQVWMDQRQGDWVIRRTYEIKRVSKRAPIFEVADIERRGE